MAVKIDRDTLTDKQKDDIRKHLYMQPKTTGFFKKKHFVQAKDPILLWHIDKPSNQVIVPYTFGNALIGEHINSKKNYPGGKYNFIGTLRTHQEPIVRQATEHLNTLGTTILGVYPGCGKCLAPGTEILMYDGSKKKVEEIVIGDILMGDDSKPRTVLSTTTGEDSMYEINPVKGEPFTVNEPHILTLYASCHGKVVKSENRFRVSWFNGKDIEEKSFDTQEEADVYSQFVKNNIPNIYDIPLNEYIKLPVSVKHVLKCFWVPVEYPAKEVPIDPYFLGLWLGYGESSTTKITDTDREIIDYFYRFAENEGLDFNQCSYEEITYSITGINSGNSLKKRLQELDLFINKHIPQIYKVNSRDVRLKLLAGLIDINGYQFKNCYEITQKSKRLAYDILDLCRSLGFASFIQSVIKSCIYNGEVKEGLYYKVSIYGTHEIPVLLERKKLQPNLHKENLLITDFDVIPKGKGKYYGFTLDGNGRFLLGSYMVTHNTAMSAYLASQLGGLTLVVHPIKVVEPGWVNTFKQFTDASIWLNDGANPIPNSCNVIITMDTQFHKIPTQILDMVKILIIDEAHMFCVPSRIHCLLGVTPQYIIACTATLNRSDGMESIIHSVCGTHGVFIKSPQKFVVYRLATGIKIDIEKNKNGDTDWPKLVKSLSEDPVRNAMIINLVERNIQHKIMILTWNKNHAYFLAKILKERGTSADVLAGNKSTYKDSRVLVGTISKIGTGFDEAMACPDWSGERSNMLILTGSTKSLSGLEQITGRVFRSEFPTIIDLVDDNRICKSHWTQRKKWYEEESRNGEIQYIEMKKDERVQSNNETMNEEEDNGETSIKDVKSINSSSITRAKLRILNKGL
jgi:superfamily II DNA or RNA helicase